VLAVSPDTSAVNREHSRKMGMTFTFLSDEKREVIRLYDLLHPDGGPEGATARPAEFLIDSSGTVRWRQLTEDYRVRARPEQVLQVVDGLR